MDPTDLLYFLLLVSVVQAAPHQVSVVQAAPHQVSVVQAAPHQVSVVQAAPHQVSVVQAAPHQVSVVQAAPHQVSVVQAAPHQVSVVQAAPHQVSVVQAAPHQVSVVQAAPHQVSVVQAAPHQVSVVQAAPHQVSVVQAAPHQVSVVQAAPHQVSVVQAAPHQVSVGPPQTRTRIRQAADRAKTLVEKILLELPAAHRETVSTQGFSLDGAAQGGLQLLVASMGVPPPPVLKPLSPRFPPGVCVSRMLEGSRRFLELLEFLSPKLGGLQDLKVDLRDLLTHIAKLKEASLDLDLDQDQNPGLDLDQDQNPGLDLDLDQNPGLDLDQDQSPGLDLAPHLGDSYRVQVLVHMTLVQLRSFCHDLLRSLRALPGYRG